MEYALTFEEVEALETITLEDLEIELLYQDFLNNQAYLPA